MKPNLRLSVVLLLLLAISGLAQTPQAVEQNLRKHVEYLASDKLEGRRSGEKGATEAAGYIAVQFAKLRLKSAARSANGKAGYLQTFSYTPARDPHSTPAEPTSMSTAPDARTAYNVVGILDGRDKLLRNEAIVIGAHYDHLGRGGHGSLAASSTDIHHGADDNASGTAAILELARQFVKEKKNKRTIVFIAFSGEEDGLFGSKYYVNNPVWPLDKTIAMINLDMVGRLSRYTVKQNSGGGQPIYEKGKLTIGGIGTASEWKRLISDLSENAYVPTQTTSGPGQVKASATFDLQLNEDGFGPSDHSSFYAKQIPVLFFFTGTHLDYHKPTDTAEKINYEGLTQITSYVREIVKAVDQNPQKPTYTVAKSSGTMGRTGFNVSLGTIPSYADATDGLVLDGVRENSPAAKAGIKAGDKIVKLAGKDVRNVSDYTFVLGTMKAGEEYEVQLLRGTERLTLKIIPAPATKR